MSDFFKGLSPVKYEGPDSTNPLAFHYYNADEVILGKSMKDHLRFAIAYWHSFANEASDPFGPDSFQRPWYGDEMKDAENKTVETS